MTVPVAEFSAVLRQLAEGRRLVDLPVGHGWRTGGGLEVIAARQPTPGQEFARLLLTDFLPSVLPADLPARCRAVLAVGDGPAAGRAAGWVRTTQDRWEPLGLLRQPGPGMQRLMLRGHPDAALRPPPDLTSHSRTVDALGDSAYRRAVSLRVGVGGCGRIGSRVAHELARFGIVNLTLIDFDVVELSNTGESLFSRADVGLPKVRVLERDLAVAWPGIHTRAVESSATRWAAIRALRECDFIFVCPDHPVARMSSAAVASCFRIPFIDLGTRIFRDGPVRMSADVRLVPTERCLLCCGSVENEPEGLRLLLSADAEDEFYRHRDGKAERAGSLASLNQLAVGMALRVFEDFVAGHVAGPVWHHFEFLPGGRFLHTNPVPAAPGNRSTTCLCRVAGWAESGLLEVPAILGASSRDQ